MRSVLHLWITATAVALALGCDQKPGTASTVKAPSPANSAAVDDAPSRAQPKLAVIDLFLGRHRIQAEVARSLTEIRTGMMFRQSIGEDEGMLFVFGRPHRAAFWMKNVTVELSVAYLDPEGRVLEIHDLEPGEEEPVSAESDRVQFVLETSRGWFERHDIKPGTLTRTSAGSLKDTFRLP